MSDVDARLGPLEREIAGLNRKIKYLFNIIDTSTDKEPFLRLMVSVDATDDQETAAIYDLMDEYAGRRDNELRPEDELPGVARHPPLDRALHTRR